MKIKILLLTLALGSSTCLLTAQDSDQRPERRDRPERRERPERPDRAGRPGREGRPEGPGFQRGGPGGPGGERFVPPIVAVLDLDRNGTIDADEIAKASRSLRKLDKNKDGNITPEEYRPQRPGGPRGPGGFRGPGGPRRGPGGPGGRDGDDDRPRRPRAE